MDVFITQPSNPTIRHRENRESSISQTNFLSKSESTRSFREISMNNNKLKEIIKNSSEVMNETYYEKGVSKKYKAREQPGFLKEKVKIDVLNYLIDNEPKISDIEKIAVELDNSVLRQRQIFDAQNSLLTTKRKEVDSLKSHIHNEMIASIPLYCDISSNLNDLDDEIFKLRQKVEIAEDDYYKQCAMLTNENNKSQQYKKFYNQALREVDKSERKLEKLFIARTEFESNLKSEIILMNKCIVFKSALDDKLKQETSTKQLRLEDLTKEFKEVKHEISKKKDNLKEIKGQAEFIKSQISSEKDRHQTLIRLNKESNLFIIQTKIQLFSIFEFFGTDDLETLAFNYKDALNIYNSKKNDFSMANHEVVMLNNQLSSLEVEFAAIKKRLEEEDQINSYESVDSMNLTKVIITIKQMNESIQANFKATVQYLKRFFELKSRLQYAIASKVKNCETQYLNNNTITNSHSQHLNSTEEGNFAKKSIVLDRANNLQLKINKLSINKSPKKIGKKHIHSNSVLNSTSSNNISEVKGNIIDWIIINPTAQNISLLISLINKFLFRVIKFCKESSNIKSYIPINSKSTKTVWNLAAARASTFKPAALKTLELTFAKGIRNSKKNLLHCKDDSILLPSQVYQENKMKSKLSLMRFDPSSTAPSNHIQSETLEMKQHQSQSDLRNKSNIVNFISQFIIQKEKKNPQAAELKKRKNTNKKPKKQHSIEGLNLITDSSSSSSNKQPEEYQDNDSYIQSQAYESHKQHNYTSNARKRKKNNIILNAFEHEVNKKKTLPFDKENFELSLYNFYKKNKAFYNQAIVNTKSKLREACMNLTHKLNHVRVASPHFKNSGTRKPTFSSKTSHMIVDAKARTQRGSPSPSINAHKSSRVYDESSLYKLKTFKPSDSYRDLQAKQYFMLKTFKGDKDDLSAKDSNHDSYVSSKFKPRQHESKSLNQHIATSHKTKRSERQRVNGIRAIMQFNIDDYSLPPSLKSVQTTSQLQTLRQPDLPTIHK